jgi:sacsin
LRSLVETGREKFGMRLVPWAAVAAELETETSAETSAEEDPNALASTAGEHSREPTGRAFCFLPLPCAHGPARARQRVLRAFQ